MATVTGTNQAETIDAADGVTNGNDTIFGFGGADRIFGLGGADIIHGGTGDDIIDGGSGNDVIDGGSGADVIDGGVGFDTADYSESTAAVSVNLATGRGTGGFAQGDIITNIDDVVGSDFDDTITGNGGANQLTGGDGNDTLSGGGDNDLLFGGAGNDTLNGGIGNDRMTGGAGSDDFIGGEGHDMVVYDDSTAGVSVNLDGGSGSGGTAQGDTYDSIENALGSNFDDVMIGTDVTNLLNGLDGNDILKGGGGGDALFGQIGDDVLKGGGGADLMFGDIGTDKLFGEEDDDFLDGGAGADTMSGGLGDDSFRVDNAGDVVNETTGQGHDTVLAVASYTLTAGAEVEVLQAESPGGTTPLDLFGNEFDNTIIGNNTSNVLAGSSSIDSGGFDGLDTLTGGGGGDTFVWTRTAETGVAGNEADIITDFSRAQDDVIALNPIDADETVAGDQAFTFIGTGAFTAAGQINFFTTATDTFIQLNTDGDNFAEATIHLLGVHNVDAGFFVL